MHTIAPVFFGAALAAFGGVDTAWSQEGKSVGLVAGSFHASCVPPSEGSGCAPLLVTGHFMAPTPGYQLSVTPVNPQKSPLIFELELSATPPTGTVTQVLTLMPVEYVDTKFPDSPYGVSISYENQREIVGLMIADTVKSRP